MRLKIRNFIGGVFHALRSLGKLGGFYGWVASFILFPFDSARGKLGWQLSAVTVSTEIDEKTSLSYSRLLLCAPRRWHSSSQHRVEDGVKEGCLGSVVLVLMWAFSSYSSARAGLLFTILTTGMRNSLDWLQSRDVFCTRKRRRNMSGIRPSVFSA